MSIVHLTPFLLGRSLVGREWGFKNRASSSLRIYVAASLMTHYVLLMPRYRVIFISGGPEMEPETCVQCGLSKKPICWVQHACSIREQLTQCLSCLLADEGTPCRHQPECQQAISRSLNYGLTSWGVLTL